MILKLIQKLFRIPGVGEINNRFLYTAPQLSDSRFGDTTHLPTVLEIYIDTGHQWPLEIGKKVKAVLFQNYPPIVFNVCFACSRPSFFKRISNYANPNSHWFNVFFGFYEINAPCSKWNRAFGFTENGELNKDDLIRLGKADWNYFSNYLYGVPDTYCEQNSLISGNEQISITNSNKVINNQKYIEVEMSNIQVVSGYCASGDSLLNNQPIVSQLWRKVFGIYPAIDNISQSFMSCTMKMKFYIRYDIVWDNDLQEKAYNTYVCGGTINMHYTNTMYNEQFLNAQMQGLEKCMKKTPFHKNKNSNILATWKKELYK